MILAMILQSLLGAALSSDASPLLRYPDLHGDSVVFVHGDDLWTASVQGGLARRLTLHDGTERYPKFSPDGKSIAFTAQYDGNSDVYVMTKDGGSISRVTYHPGVDTMVGWHPDGTKILFTSNRRAYSRFNRLYAISPDGTGLQELPMHEGTAGSHSQDGKRIAYNRVARENRTWKRYEGGLAQDIRILDLETLEDTLITDWRGTDRHPMWSGDNVYFSSDRTRVLNIWSYDTKSGQTTQVTRHEDYDVRYPSLGDGGRIVYELGGSLWVFEPGAGSRQIPIQVAQDAPEARVRVEDVSDEITQAHVSPGGERAVIVARGEVFTVPRERGPTRNLSNQSGARDKDAVWSPDGQKIAFVSDRDGEYALYVQDEKGERPPRQLTKHDSGYRHTLRWSPDSKKIAFADQTLRFFYVDITTSEIVEVDRSSTEPVDVGIDHKPIYDYQWSPDSRYIAYSKMDEGLTSRVLIHEVATRSNILVSTSTFNDFGPVFTRDGRRLLFVSNRRFDPTLCDFEWEMVYKKVAGIYAVTLRQDDESFLPPRSDEVPGKQAKSEAEKGASTEVQVRIDVEGLGDRIEALPLPRGNYRELRVNEDTLFFLNADEGDFNRFEYRAVSSMDLHAYSFASRSSSSVIQGVSSYEVSAKGSHLVYMKGGQAGIIPSSARSSKGHSLDLSGLEMELDPRAEWGQIFAEAWRMERDFYYEPEMHGQDWGAMRVKYERLLPGASTREDVRYLIGELIGELNTSHTYVFGGDRQRRADSRNVGLLGADWELDKKTSRYRLSRILRVPDWTLSTWPPLARPGLNVEDGSYLLKLDGRELRGDKNFYSYFQGMAGKQVTLTLAKNANGEGARDLQVVPIGSESTLRYRDWVERNRRLVDSLSGGEVGYLHLPDTYLSSMREFPKYFYTQTQKKGLIIDGRFNGGGLDPDIFLQRLGRHPIAYWTRRYSSPPQTTPAVSTLAHTVCLTNRQAGSGGDMLPMEFQMRGMGPVVGTKTWGGLVGVSMFYSLIDGGGLTAPDYRIYTPEGRWIVENEGVTPDVEVDLTVRDMAEGRDTQLLKGLEEVLQMMSREPRSMPPHPPYPVDR